MGLLEAVGGGGQGPPISGEKTTTEERKVKHNLWIHWKKKKGKLLSKRHSFP